MHSETPTGARAALLNYALQGLGLPATFETAFDLTPYFNLLPRGSTQRALLSILTTLRPPDKQGNTTANVPPLPLTLNREAIMPGGAGADDWTSSFRAEWSSAVADPVTDFETATELVRKYGWSVAGTRGEPGVSLYQEFKHLSALVHASGCSSEPATRFTLIGGDFPGIQHAIYTITSKGAAKALRGRSFFLQLLGDAVVRRLLVELGDLPWTNVVYLAGGNFVLLAGQDAEAVVAEWTHSVNGQLLSSFQGDISLVTACQALDGTDLANPARPYAALKQALQAAKQRPFADVGFEERDRLFEPSGGRSEKHCAVCHVDPDAPGDLTPVADGFWCEECLGFDSLARRLAVHHNYLSVTDWPDEENTGWQTQLYGMTGWWYELHDQPPTDGRLFYKLNSTDFITDGAAGFRFLATRTPRDGYEIRDFEELAAQSVGVERIGILRMDVDNLGRIFKDYIRPFTLTRLSAASDAMSLFFDGWLNVICEEVEHDCPDCLYVIYAGGDDLFVVGPWSLMPVLAQRIRDDLAEYVNYNPHITISAGISVEEPRYPLYRAAERAREALDEGAKGEWYGLDGKRHQKNAISFLGEVVGWDDGWPLVSEECGRMLGLIELGMPKALHQTIRRIHAQYEEQRQQAMQQGRVKLGQLVYGRWMWMQAYSLSRLAEQHKKRIPGAPAEIQQIQEKLLTPETIHLAGLAARWADYLQRSKQPE